MLKSTLIIGCLCPLAAVGIAGVSWKGVWMEPFEVIFQPGQSVHYSIKGMRLGDVVVDITSAPELKVSSADQTILAVNLQDHTLIAKETGSHPSPDFLWTDHGNLRSICKPSK